MGFNSAFKGLKQIPLAMWSNSQVCGRLTAGIVGSNPAEHMVVRLVFVVCCVSSDLCDELIIHSEESHRILSSITNKMQRYTIFFITVNALHVSGGFSAHHQELKKCTHRGETARNMYSIDDNKECCITLHLVGCT